MAQRLTTFSKFLITLVIVAIIAFGVRWALQNTDAGQKLSEQAEQVEGANNSSSSDASTGNNNNSTTTKSASSSGNSDDVLTVQVFTWGGIAPGLYFNGGADPNSCLLYTSPSPRDS